MTGTNGKGTVSLNIAKGIERDGNKTGLLSSPHFECVTERISINQRNITKDRMQKIYKENKEYLEGLMFFELLTYIGLIYFSEEKVDYAVIEVGLGGLMDTTNVIKPELSVITNISLDHQNFLGTTLESIARNKAGIIKRDTPVVLGRNARRKECYEVASKKNAKIYELNEVQSDYLLENKAISDKSLRVLGINPPCEVYKPPARFEVHGRFVFDMAHNEAAFLALKRKILKEYPGKKIIAIWNMSHDKDVKACLFILQSFTQNVFFFPHSFHQLISVEKARSLGVSEYNGETSDIVLICGSVYFLSTAKKQFINS